MSRLYDRIMADKGDGWLKQILKGASVVSMDNVVDFLADGKSFPIEQLPTVNPPFWKMFIETDHVTKTKSEAATYFDGKSSKRHETQSYGVFIVKSKTDQSLPMSAFIVLEHHVRWMIETIHFSLNEAGSIVDTTYNFRDDMGTGLYLREIFKHKILLTYDHRTVPDDWLQSEMRRLIAQGQDGADAYDKLLDLHMETIEHDPEYQAETQRILKEHESEFLLLKEEFIEKTVNPLLDPAIFALSLMNSKNVELIDNKPSAGMSRKQVRRCGEPLVTFKTIKVNPMRTVKHSTDPTTTPQKPTESDNNHPLSIWRGHFKDFRDGKGLFGKYKSVYWWDQHVRGSIENGAVIKDYDVLAPKNPNQPIPE